MPSQRAVAVGPAIAALVQKRIVAAAIAPGRRAARDSTAMVDWPSPAESTEASTSASGPSTPAADSAACQAVLVLPPSAAGSRTVIVVSPPEVLAPVSDATCPAPAA